MKATVDAFGTEVIIGDTVVFFTNGWCKNNGDLQKGEVIKCTSHGATVAFGSQKVNVRSGRIYRINDDYNRFNSRLHKDEQDMLDELNRINSNQMLFGGSNGQQRLQLRINKSITIPKEEYEDLLESQKFLMELEVLGVKHWEDYKLACKAMEGNQ